MHKYIPKYGKTSKDYCSLWLLAILVSSSFLCHAYDQFDVKKMKMQSKLKNYQ